MSASAPSTQQILEQMRVSMGEVPSAIEKAEGADTRMVLEHARSSAFAMPPEDRALDPLIHVPIALATSNSGRARSPW